MNIKSAVNKRPFLVYIIFTCLISWLGLFAVTGPGIFSGMQDPAPAQLLLMFLAMYAGPSISGLVLTGIIDGKKGLRALFSRLRIKHTGIQWYIIAVLAAPVFVLASLLILSRSSPAFLPGLFSSGFDTSLISMGIVFGLMTGFFEELGWTGFAVPRLRSKHGAFTTGILIGAAWGLWHLPLFLTRDPAGTVPFLLLLFGRLFTQLPAFRVLMVRLYDRTGSLPAVMLMHAGLTASSLIIQMQSSAGIHIIISNCALAVLLYLFLGLIYYLRKSGKVGKTNTYSTIKEISI